jgi:hypothetical protein
MQLYQYEHILLAMQPPSAIDLLNLWEQGQNWHPVQRGLGLLQLACPQLPIDLLAQLSLGQRDACLLSLREQMFGSQLVSVATCPECGERLELTLNLADLRLEPLPPIVNGADVEDFSPQRFSIDVTDYQVQFRLPNSFDLASIITASFSDPQRYLLDRCLLVVQHRGESISPEQLPSTVREVIMQRMAEVDPQADIQIAMTCPVCQHRWQATFDILSFFWSEINVWATRILAEVHMLATAYGWREADILRLSPYRRQIYLELLNQRQGVAPSSRSSFLS